MKRFFIFLFVLILVQSLFTLTLCAQLKPGAASPISDVTMPTISKSDVSNQSSLAKLNSVASVSTSTLAGGNRLVALQNTDGGWGWPLTGTSAQNIVGPIAMGLAQAYQQTGNSIQRTALLNAGTFLLAKINTFSPSDGYLATQLDKIFGVTTYTNHVKTNFYDKLAAGTYDRLGLGVLYTTASYIDRIRTTRSGDQANMAAWDIGLGLVGAASCSALTADWIAGVKAEIDELDGNNYYDVIGLAGAVYGLAFIHEDYDPIAGQHVAASNINDLANILLSYQISGGGFTWNSGYVSSGNETNQETGYAILALNEVNRSTYLTSIQGAADYLMTVQLGTGGWDDYPGDPYGENNEITGEALWGISVTYPSPVHNVTKDVYYPTIPVAISDASTGNVIQVAPGTYPGGITINKSLTLLGDPGDTNPGPGTNAPVVDGGGANIDAFKISNGVTNVTINGFVIQNFSSPGYNTIGSGIQAWVGSTSYITIQDNSFLNLGYNGILVGNDYNSDPNKWSDHAYWTVKNNIVSNCGYIGFELTNTSNSSIEDNVIHLATPYIGAIFSSARRTEAGLTIKNNLIDGTPSIAFPVIYMYAYDCDMPNPNLNNVLIESNNIVTVGTPAQIYIRNINTGTVTGVTVVKNNLTSLKTNTPAVITAINNYWGSPNGPVNEKNVFNMGSQGGTVSIATGGSLPTFCPWWKDISGVPGTYTGTSFAPITNNDVPVENYSNFSGAIAGTTAGGIVNAVAGTYTEGSPQIVINKNISIIGADKNTTIILPAQNTGSSGDARGWFLVNSGMTFNLSNVTLDGAGKLVNIGILSHGPGTINNNILKNIGYNPSGPDYTGRAIAFYDVNMSVTNNTLSNIGRIGLYMYGAGVTNGVISGNTYTGKGIGNWLDYGIEIEGGAHATITGNTVTNCTGVASVDGSTSAGMLITTYFTLGAQAILTDNTFSGNYIGIAVGYSADDQSTVIAHYNNFSGNTDFGILSTNPFVDATNNYWGSLYGPLDVAGTVEIPKSPKPAVIDMKNALPVSVLGNAVSDNVDYYPWLGSYTSITSGGGIWAGGYVNPTANSIYAGLDVSALDGVDAMDVVAPPPPPSDYLYMYFLLAPGQPIQNYSSDIKKDESSLAGTAKIWDLRVITDHTSSLVTLEFPLAGLPSGFNPVLYDLSTGDFQNLREFPYYTYTSPASEVTSDFKLLIGDSTKPSITVTSPNGGDFLVVGTPCTITWSSSDASGLLSHDVYYSLTGGAPYTLISTVNGSVYSIPWTPSSVSSSASIKVVVRDSVLNEQYDLSNQTFTILATNSISLNATAGWNLVSPAMQQVDMTPAGVFSDDYSIPYYTFQYNPSGGYSVPSALNMGQGYWLGSNSSATVDAEGTPLTTANRLLLNGFNIIGNPYSVAILKDNLIFTDGGTTKTMAEAATAGWLSNVLYGYNGSGYEFENITLGVWKGYWIPMMTDGITIQYHTTVGIPTPKITPAVVEATAKHWSLDLEAALVSQNEEYIDRIASFGVRNDATDGFDPMYDAPRPPRSPSNEFIEVNFQIDAKDYPIFAGSNYARDYKNSNNPIWEFTVVNSKEGTINLQWGNEAISKLTSDIKIELYDVSENRIIDMKKVNSYSYEQIGTNRKFTINKIDRVIPTAFELLQNYPNPFNPTTTITYALPFNANVSVQVYDFVGRKVAILIEENQEAGYHDVKFDASQISSGLYFYHMTAIGENGKQFSDSKKMMLLK